MKTIAHFITLVLCIFSTAFVSSQNYCDDVKAAQQMVNVEQNRFRDFFNNHFLLLNLPNRS